MKTQFIPKNDTEDMNIELLNVINEDVENVKQWSQMPPISDELYQELVKEFNNERHYFFNVSYTLED